MNLGEILDRTFQIFRSRFLVLVVIAAIPSFIVMCIELADVFWLHSHSLVHPFRQPGIFLWNFAVWLAFYHIASVLTFLSFPGQIHQVSSAVLGNKSSIRASFRFTAERWRSYLWIVVLKLLAMMVIPELLVAGLIAGTALIVDKAEGLNGGPDFPIFLIVALPTAGGIVAFLWLGACLSLAVPAGALENISGVNTLRRSWMLTRGSRLRILTAFLLSYVFGWIVLSGVQLAFRWAVFYVHSGPPFGMVGQRAYLAAFYLVYAATSALIAPIYPIAVTLIYYDQRIRHEGYDIERMMEAAGLNTPATLPASEPATTHVGVEEAQA
jgi:hypothetical protein